MEITSLTIKIIVLLLPGIFSLFFIETLTREKKYSLREYITYVIMLGFLSYFCLFLILNFIELFKEGYNHFKLQRLVFFSALIDNNETIKISEVFWATFIGIILSILISKVIHKGLYYKFFQKRHITNRSGRDVWGEIFHNNGDSIDDYVYVKDMKKDITYGGELLNYSHDSSNPELVLGTVRIDMKDENGKNQVKKVNKLYMNLEKGIEIDIERRDKKDEHKENGRN